MAVASKKVLRRVARGHLVRKALQRRGYMESGAVVVGLTKREANLVADGVRLGGRNARIGKSQGAGYEVRVGAKKKRNAPPW